MRESSHRITRIAWQRGGTSIPRASDPSTLEALLQDVLARPGVAVVDVIVSAEENVYPMVPPGAGLKEMVLG